MCSGRVIPGPGSSPGQALTRNPAGGGAGGLDSRLRGNDGRRHKIVNYTSSLLLTDH